MVSSPFPGMDPFLEINPRWEVFHGWFIRELARRSVGPARELGCEVEALYCEPDGNFPNHLADPTVPEFMADLIDHPLRRKFQPPYETAVRHSLEPGMTVLEVGPGSGTYTLGAAQRVGEQGRLVTVDIEPKMIERVTRRAEAEGIENIEARVANVYDLPFEDGTFDVVYMIAVIGEIPEPLRAMREFHRVLSPSGTLVFSELVVDPDYPRLGFSNCDHTSLYCELGGG